MEREGVFLNVPAWADVTCHTSPHKLIQHTSAEPQMHATPCTLLITFSAHWSPALHPARCSQDGGWWVVDAGEWRRSAIRGTPLRGRLTNPACPPDRSGSGATPHAAVAPRIATGELVLWVCRARFPGGGGCGALLDLGGGGLVGALWRAPVGPWPWPGLVGGGRDGGRPCCEWVASTR